MEKQQFFATAALGLEPLLADELRQIGIYEVKEERAGVSFAGTLKDAYQTCLWSRLASRILLPLAQFEAADPDQLYAEALKIDWSDHLSCAETMAIDCALSHSTINHSRYAALRVKDALVDQFKARLEIAPLCPWSVLMSV